MQAWLWWFFGMSLGWLVLLMKTTTIVQIL